MLSNTTSLMLRIIKLWRIMKISSFSLNDSKCFQTTPIWLSLTVLKFVPHECSLGFSPNFQTIVLLFKKLWCPCRHLAHNFTFFSCVCLCTLTWRRKWLKTRILSSFYSKCCRMMLQIISCCTISSLPYSCPLFPIGRKNFYWYRNNPQLRTKPAYSLI